MIAASSPVSLPLVEPAAELTPQQRARAARQMRLPGFGDEAQRRLAAARVLVVGAGGLGSASVPYLAGAGVGTIGIVDDDLVELSNLHRQVSHTTADIGRAKTASLIDTVHALDPAIVTREHRVRLTSENALEIFRDYDLIVDGSDNFPTRYLVADAAELCGLPLVWGSILQHHGQVGVSWRSRGAGYRDLFPVPPAPEDVVDCGTGGVLPGLCGTIGSLLATETLKLITGIGAPLIDRVLVYDALAASTREIGYRRDPAAQPVTELIDYELFCAGPDAPPPFVTAEALAAELEGDSAPQIVDVREDGERELLRLPAALALPLGELETQPPRLVGPITVLCERDPRSIRAAKLLVNQGVADVRFVRGGIRALAEVAPTLLAGTDLED